MKVFLIAILFFTPMLSKADQSVEIRTQQTLDMLNQALATRSYNNLSADLKENVLQHALKALRTIRGDISRPLPSLPTAPSVPILVITDASEISFGVKSVAIVESTLLVFHTLDRGQVFQECLVGLKSSTNGIYQIALTSGSQKTQYHYNSGYWSKQAACELVANRLELSSNFTPRSVSIKGSIGKTVIDFLGESNADILEQCHIKLNTGPSKLKPSVYEMFLSVDQGLLKRIYNHNSYWNGSVQICAKVLENI